MADLRWGIVAFCFLTLRLLAFAEPNETGTKFSTTQSNFFSDSTKPNCQVLENSLNSRFDACRFDFSFPYFAKMSDSECALLFTQTKQKSDFIQSDLGKMSVACCKETEDKFKEYYDLPNAAKRWQLDPQSFAPLEGQFLNNVFNERQTVTQEARERRHQDAFSQNYSPISKCNFPNTPENLENFELCKSVNSFTSDFQFLNQHGTAGNSLSCAMMKAPGEPSYADRWKRITSDPLTQINVAMTLDPKVRKYEQAAFKLAGNHAAKRPNCARGVDMILCYPDEINQSVIGKKRHHSSGVSLSMMVRHMDSARPGAGELRANCDDPDILDKYVWGDAKTLADVLERKKGYFDLLKCKNLNVNAKNAPSGSILYFAPSKTHCPKAHIEIKARAPDNEGRYMCHGENVVTEESADRTCYISDFGKTSPRDDYDGPGCHERKLSKVLIKVNDEKVMNEISRLCNSGSR